jgi:lambda family phage holin
MPEKDPNNWAALFVLWESLPPAIQGAIMAAVIALLRVLYDDKETTRTRIGLEAALCGCLSLTCSSGLSWVGAPDSVAVAIGGGIGFIGVTKLRELAISWLGKKAGKDAN